MILLPPGQNAGIRYFCTVSEEGLKAEEIDRVVEMAWEDRTPFEAIEFQFGLAEPDVIALMRRELKANSFKRWRKRVQGRATKHLQLRSNGVSRFKSSRQKAISGNRISKR